VLAARQAARRMSATDRRRVARLLAEVGRRMHNGDKQRILQLEQDFHLFILDASGNKPLADLGRTILDRIWIIQNINLLTTDHLTDAHPQHLNLFAAITDGDPARAARLMERHLQYAKAFVLSRLKADGDILSKLMMGFPSIEPGIHSGGL